METQYNLYGTLTLSGEGQVHAKPDIAHLNLGVVTEAQTAQDATATNAQRMNQVLESMRGLGIKEEDLQTIGFNIAPVLDWKEGSPTYGRILGYRVEDILSVTADLALAGKVLDEGITAGATVAGGLSFGLRDESLVRQRALQAAVKAAHVDAVTVARAMNVPLKDARAAEVVYGGTPVIMRLALKEARANTPIEGGILQITASVRMVYSYQNQERKAKEER